MAVEDDARQFVTRLVDRRAADPVHVLCHAMRRKDRQPLLVRRDEHDHHPRARVGAVLFVERERGLVAMMTVGDQQLQVGDVRPAADAPEAVAADLEVGRAVRDVRGRAVVKEEDRLELRACRAQETQAALLRARVRALVRQDDATVVRLDLQRDDVAVPRALDTVRSDVRLRQRPRRRLAALDEHTRSAPVAEVARRLLLAVGERQVNNVERASREVVRAFRVGDDVVRRRDEILERPGLRRVVAHRTKRLRLRHPGGT